jgi:all-trans-retinol dehydrogenase (NAD+)
MESWWMIGVGLVVIFLFKLGGSRKKDVSGKVILITGGGSGLGLGMARKFADLGAHVVLWDINAQALREVNDELKGKNQLVTTYVCDVSDRPTIYSVAEKVKKEVGKVDILINNAGIVIGKPFLETTDEQSEKVVKVNTMAIMWTTKAFLPDMLKSAGHLVTISSAAGHTGAPNLVDYCASKFAAIGFTEALRQELMHQRVKNIKFTTVMPYYINTGMFAGVKSRFPFPILEPEYVISNIVAAVLREDVEVHLPSLTMSRYLVHFLPVWLGDYMEGWLGISSAMDEFRGRQQK